MMQRFSPNDNAKDKDERFFLIEFENNNNTSRI